MARFEITATDVAYAQLQVKEAQKAPLGSLPWEAHLLAQDLELSEGQASLGGHLMDCMLDTYQDKKNHGRKRFAVMRGLLTWVFSAPFSALGNRLPLLVVRDLDELEAAYKSSTWEESLAALKEDVETSMKSFNELWSSVLVKNIPSLTDEFNQWTLFSCARILLIKLEQEQNRTEGATTDMTSVVGWLESQRAGGTSKPPKGDGGTRKPKVTFADLGGYRDIKEKLTKLARRVANPSRGERWGSKPLKGILFKGPKGVGKGAMAEAFAHATGLKFRPLSIGNSMSKWVNQSVEKVQKIFEDARASGGMVLFFDEADAIIGSRGASIGHREDDKVVNEFNIQMDRITREHRVVVVLATNFANRLDDAAIRDKRIDMIIEMGLPTESDRLEILQAIIDRTERLASSAVFVKDIQLQTVAQQSRGLSGAALENIIDRALWRKEDEDLDDLTPGLVSTQDLLDAVQARLKERPDRKRIVIGFSTAKPLRPEASEDLLTMLAVDSEG